MPKLVTEGLIRKRQAPSSCGIATAFLVLAPLIAVSGGIFVSTPLYHAIRGADVMLDVLELDQTYVRTAILVPVIALLSHGGLYVLLSAQLDQMYVSLHPNMGHPTGSMAVGGSCLSQTSQSWFGPCFRSH